jgi:transcriptional regulator with XRE-family HTH domain
MSRARFLLRDARKRAGLSQRELAERGGFPQSTVGRIEAGTLEPRVDTLERLLRACGRLLESAPGAADDFDRQAIRDSLALTPIARLISTASAQPLFDPGRMVSILARQRVDYVVMGGLAARLHGSPFTTSDMDICYTRAGDNVERLAAALRDLQARVEVRALRAGGSFSFKTMAGQLNCTTRVPGVAGFPDLLAGAEQVQVATNVVRVASLDDLIAIKRSEDFEAVEHLAAVREERERDASRGLTPRMTPAARSRAR